MDDGGQLRVEAIDARHTAADGSGVTALHAASFDAPAGGVLGLLGPSGCGKTTCLKAIAGLLKPTAGRITFGEHVLFSHEQRIDVPVEARRIGLMFQSYAIWPHMTVLENAAFALRVGAGRLSEAEAQRRAGEALERMRLSALAGRRATDLSGGQQQRLALARALAPRPRLLLLDEPLSNLEPSLRAQMTGELRELQRETGLTMVVVTHDHAEALALADRLVLLREGRVQQAGTPREIYTHPVNGFVAGFLGRINRVDAARWAALAAPGAWSPAAPPARGRWAGIRPEALVLSDERPAAGPALAATVQRVTFLGDALEVELRADDGAGLPALLARVSARVAVQPGERRWLTWSAGDVILFDDDDS